MSDQELLKLAADACGFYFRIEDGVSYASEHKYHGEKPWNPIEDDGDALRLVAKLSIHLRVCRRIVMADMNHVGLYEAIQRDHKGDVCSATRRAIVRCAAEIGRSMS